MWPKAARIQAIDLGESCDTTLPIPHHRWIQSKPWTVIKAETRKAESRKQKFGKRKFGKRKFGKQKAEIGSSGSGERGATISAFSFLLSAFHRKRKKSLRPRWLVGALGVSVVTITLDKPGLAETHLAAHDVKHERSLAVVAVENATRSLDNLAVARLPHLRGTGTALWLLHKLLDVPEDSLNETTRRLRVIESDVIRNGVEVMESGFSPD
jgi:hypothetical protein